MTAARRGTLRLAHRGDSRVAPENTIPALLAALRVPGCDGLEFDVRSAADGTPVLLHDRRLLRVQGIDAAVSDLWPDELAEHGIPTLAEAIAAVGPEAFLDVELKEDPGPDVVEILASARGRDLDNAVVSSFVPSVLGAMRARRPAWPRWFNADDLSDATLQSAAVLGCRGVAVDWRAIDERSMAAAARAGLEVCAWTVRDVATFDRVAALGVTALCVEGAALDG